MQGITLKELKAMKAFPLQSMAPWQQSMAREFVGMEKSVVYSLNDVLSEIIFRIERTGGKN